MKQRSTLGKTGIEAGKTQILRESQVKWKLHCFEMSTTRPWGSGEAFTHVNISDWARRMEESPTCMVSPPKLSINYIMVSRLIAFGQNGYVMFSWTHEVLEYCRGRYNFLKGTCGTRAAACLLQHCQKPERSPEAPGMPAEGFTSQRWKAAKGTMERNNVKLRVNDGVNGVLFNESNGETRTIQMSDWECLSSVYVLMNLLFVTWWVNHFEPHSTHLNCCRASWGSGTGFSASTPVTTVQRSSRSEASDEEEYSRDMT